MLSMGPTHLHTLVKECVMVLNCSIDVTLDSGERKGFCTGFYKDRASLAYAAVHMLHDLFSDHVAEIWQHERMLVYDLTYTDISRPINTTWFAGGVVHIRVQVFYMSTSARLDDATAIAAERDHVS